MPASSEPTAATLGLVRVSVRDGRRTASVALPTALPAVEALPEVARALGRLDPDAIHRGLRLLTSEGREVAGSDPWGRWVRSGDRLELADLDDVPPPVRDDPAAAVAAEVRRSVPAVDPGRWPARTSLGWTLLLAAWLLPGPLSAAVTAVDPAGLRDWAPGPLVVTGLLVLLLLAAPADERDADG